MGKFVKPVAKEGRMNKAAAKQPKAGHNPPAAKGNKGPGPEKHADMAGAQLGHASDGLSGAVSHLRKMHPQKWDDRGPHRDRD